MERVESPEERDARELREEWVERRKSRDVQAGIRLTNLVAWCTGGAHQIVLAEAMAHRAVRGPLQ